MDVGIHSTSINKDTVKACLLLPLKLAKTLERGPSASRSAAAPLLLQRGLTLLRFCLIAPHNWGPPLKLKYI